MPSYFSQGTDPPKSSIMSLFYHLRCITVVLLDSPVLCSGTISIITQFPFNFTLLFHTAYSNDSLYNAKHDYFIYNNIFVGNFFKEKPLVIIAIRSLSSIDSPLSIISDYG